MKAIVPVARFFDYAAPDEIFTMERLLGGTVDVVSAAAVTVRSARSVRLNHFLVLLVGVDGRSEIKIIFRKRLNVDVVAEATFGMDQVVNGSLFVLRFANGEVASDFLLI